ncbi:MAG: class 1 fructose-bisphosphatase [Myxococcales bacterium]|nr:class 1 fructose-bisphosphatase [Myxococcales bacterium]
MLGRPEARGYFTSLLSQIALASKLVTSRVRRAGLANVLGYTGETNVQGEQVQKLDQEANETLMRILSRRGVCAAAASEEEETMRLLATGDSARYVVTFDPLDGSSNIDVNISIGTIFAVLRRTTEGTATEADFLQKGSEIQAAGYVIYGSSTMFVITTGKGVHGFTYDPTVGEFLLSHENIRVPRRGDTYSINEGNAAHWTKGVRAWNDWIKTPGGDPKRPYRQRYVGTLVADAHRTLLRGGIFAYPADTKNETGKLRLLYEANPFAFLFEAAGGAATTGSRRILDIQPEALHQRVPLILGSREDVADFEAITAEHR